jgi:hypothetical protein
MKLMKKIMFTLGIAAVTAAGAFAYSVPQSSLSQLEQQLDAENAAKVSLSGTLTLKNNGFAINVGNKTYSLAGIANFGILDGFKAGATIQVDGYLDYKTVYCTTVSLDGQTYKALSISDYDYQYTDYQSLWVY